MTADTGQTVEIRRIAWLPLAIGGGAAALAIAFLMRAFQGQWQGIFVAAPLTALAVACAWAVWDGHAPLLVADAHGVRLREGAKWRGFPWDTVATVQVHPSRTLLTDGALVISPVEGEPVKVLVGLVTGYTPARQAALAGRLTALSHGRAAVARETDPAPSKRAAARFAVPRQRFSAIAGGLAHTVSQPMRAVPVQREATASFTPVDGALALNPELMPEHTTELPELEQLKRPDFDGELPE